MSQQRPTRPVFHWQRGDTGPAVAEIRAKLVRLGLLPEPAATTTPTPAPAPAAFDLAVDRAVRHCQQGRGFT